MRRPGLMHWGPSNDDPGRYDRASLVEGVLANGDTRFKVKLSDSPARVPLSELMPWPLISGI